MAIQHVSPDTDIGVILDIIERDAAVVIDDVLTKKDLDDIKNELSPYLKNDIEGDNEFTGFQTKRVGRTTDTRIFSPLLYRLSYLGN